MNLLGNRPLDRAEQQLIHELTLKKRQSKKQTMSEKQLMAKQQLAQELKLERRDPMEIESIRYALHNHLLDRSYSSAAASSTGSTSSHCSSTSVTSSIDDQFSFHERIPSGGSFGGADGRTTAAAAGNKWGLFNSASSSAIGSNWSFSCASGDHNSGRVQLECKRSNSSGSSVRDQHQNQAHDSSLDTTTATASSAGASSSSPHKPHDLDSTVASSMTSEELSRRTELEVQEANRRKEVDIRIKKCQLDQLNSELEKRLYQYEYLVAQEKALLGSYNMMLFTNEVVNNFHLTQDPL